MSTPMKGLTQFIADIRALRSHEAEQTRVNEELANIRQKFRDPGLNNYNRRKYVAKLIYIYMLGYPVDIGHQEALALTTYSKFSEKQVGYLALGLMLAESPGIVAQTISTVIADLGSMNELDTSLALNYISSLPTALPELAEPVYKLLISPTSSPAVRKKAALVLKGMYVRDSQTIQIEWIDRIVALLENPDVGVGMSVSALVKAIATESPDLCRQAYPSAVRRLEAIFYNKEYPAEQAYYDVPVPWFTVRLLELVQLFPGGGQGDELIDNILRKVLGRLIHWAANDIELANESAQHQNARNAIFFETVSVLAHVRAETDLLSQVLDPLANFLRGSDVSFRYLSLNALIALSGEPTVQSMVDVVLPLLKDRDVSVRKKTLDVLYHMGNTENVQHIAAELLDSLQTPDIAVRGETVTVLAALIEKHATSPRWYADTSLSLLKIGGTHVSPKVQHRLVQIVVNNENIQGYAARTLLDYLRGSPAAGGGMNGHGNGNSAPAAVVDGAAVSENMVAPGAYILGEFGHLIAHEPGCSPQEQFLVLLDAIGPVSSVAKQVLLTSYIKFATKYPDLRPQVVEALELHATSSELELQQRACEYLNMLLPDNQALLAVLWEEQPPFLDRNMNLLAHTDRSKPALLRQQTGLARQASQLRRQSTGRGGGAPAPPRPRAARQSTAGSLGSLPSLGSVAESDGPAQGPPARASVAAYTNDGFRIPSAPSSVATASPALRPATTGQSLGGAGPAAGPAPFSGVSGSPAGAAGPSDMPEPAPRLHSQSSISPLVPTVTGGVVPGSAAPAKETLLSSNWEHGFRYMLTHSEATIFQDALLQVACKYEFRREFGHLVLFFKNLTSAPITSLSTQLANPMGSDVLALSTKSLPQATIAPGAIAEQVIQCEARQPFAVSPTCRVTYYSGAFSEMTFKLPIVIERFMDPVRLSTRDFLQRWNQIGADGEFQKSFRNVSLTKRMPLIADDRDAAAGLNYGIADTAELGSRSVFAAGILHTSAAGKFGCLVRVEADERRENVKVTARATKKLVAVVLAKNMSNVYLL